MSLRSMTFLTTRPNVQTRWHSLLQKFKVVVLLSILMLSGCYDRKGRGEADVLRAEEVLDSADMARRQDSVLFARKHHYSENFNFVVKADTLYLMRSQPEEAVSMMPIDTFPVNRHDHLVVADIRIMPNDSIDSVWVQVARDQMTFGWAHESELLPKVVPDDPISQFISTFSDTHLLIFLVVISFIAVAYLLYIIRRKNAKIVHFNDIDSIYPTLLALTVAISATLYASIQLFAPDVWQQFYFHPTLNPFGVPPILTVFLVCVWLMLILGLACVDVVRQHLPFNDAMLYLCGLGGVCAINYIVFSLTTLYYIGYILLAVYIYYALKHYYYSSHCRYVCGQCGTPIRQKGRCPNCGAMNE